MTGDNLGLVSEHPGVDYAHLPGEEGNPLMESTLHVDWGLVLLNSARHTLAGTGNLVTGNVAFAPSDGKPHTAPDVMVIPRAAGSEFGRYEPGPNDPLPSVCVEILSPSNTRRNISERAGRLLDLGVPEVYVLDPRRDTIVQVTRHGSDLVETSAVGSYSPGLAVSFALSDGHLAVCCPAGRVVRPGDDPFGWLVEETQRADMAEAKRDAAEAAHEEMLQEMRARIAELEAELQRRTT
jgi:Uma2 family endonuclease